VKRFPCVDRLTPLRCLRLGRECQSPDLTRRRRKKTNTLEAKVDGILSLLQSANEIPKGDHLNNLAFRTHTNSFVDNDQITVPQSIVKPQAVSDGKRKYVESTPQSSTPSLPGTSSLNTLTPATSESLSTASEYLRSGAYSEVGPSVVEAEIYLAEFRNRKLNNFAFIYLSDKATTQQLQRDRPFLFLAIMAVSSTLDSQRLGLGREIKQMLSQEVLSASEGSLDVLLGLLVFITWFATLHLHIRCVAY
jgi:hypothetical protein